MRTEVYYRDNAIDGRSRKVLAALKQNIDSRIHNVAMADVYLTKDIKGLTPELAAFLFADAVAQRTAVDSPAVPKERAHNVQLQHHCRQVCAGREPFRVYSHHPG